MPFKMQAKKGYFEPLFIVWMRRVRFKNALLKGFIYDAIYFLLIINRCSISLVWSSSSQSLPIPGELRAFLHFIFSSYDRVYWFTALNRLQRGFAMNIVKIEKVAALFELTGVIIILLFAFIFQFVLYELPCPLCLLQRIGFVCIAFGFLLNLRFGFRPSHYSIIILSGLFTAFVALRQIALHIIPGTGVYGSAIFGLHLYTWSFIAAMLIVIVSTLLMGVDRQYQPTLSIRWPRFSHFLFGLLTLLILANIISVILECGLNVCPDNPIHYKLIGQLNTK